MAESPVSSLARAREQKITELSNFFANDDISLEDLERRIERVYKAANMSELETITADLRTAAKPLDDFSRAQLARTSPSVPSHIEMGSGRVLSVMGNTRRVGRWVVPRHLDVTCVMADTRIDLTQASLPPDLVEIDLSIVMTTFKLIVPPNTRVIDEAHSIMSSVASHADESTASGPIVRLSGFALMSDVKVLVRRREDPVYEDDD
jgi:hypothetical protein